MSAMILSGGMACLFLPHNETAYAGERFNQSTALTTEQLTASSIDDAASRSSQREDLTVDGTWDMGDRPEGKLTIIHADNPVVRDLINGRDEDQTPAGFNPDHATGDTGNAYAYGQCTWWAYVRRTQLGLPVGSHLGDGGMWADSAKALGYWVDDTPRQGDVIVFSPAQVNNAWGHVAIVEKVNGDGSIEISANRADGTSYPIGYLDGFTCIGDMEFCGKRDDTHQIEARTTALCIVLPLASTKELLLNDNRFLRYLLNSVTEKLMLYSSSQSNFSTLEESFLSYLSERCPDQTFSGVEKMAMQLHCSRRQLQRVLKKLLEEGQLVKLSKGSYRLS